MRTGIYGAGCVGSLIGCALQAADKKVTFFDVTQRTDAIRKAGITIQRPDGSREHYTGLTSLSESEIREADPYDVLIVCLKAHQVTGALPKLSKLIGPETIVVTTQNGLPWWYFEGFDGPYRSRTIEAADPGGRIRSTIDSRRVVGCIVYPAVSRGRDDVIVHVEGNRFPVGPVHAGSVAAAQRVSQMFIDAGFKSPVLEDIRDETWLKAVGNMSLNPISALTRSTLVEICEHEDARSLLRDMMEEAEAVANSLGARLRVSIDRRIEGARRVGQHRSSMLQDLENGVRMEVEALVASVVELGELAGVPTPKVSAVLALIRLLNDSIVESGHRNAPLRATA